MLYDCLQAIGSLIEGTFICIRRLITADQGQSMKCVTTFLWLVSMLSLSIYIWTNQCPNHFKVSLSLFEGQRSI